MSFRRPEHRMRCPPEVDHVPARARRPRPARGFTLLELLVVVGVVVLLIAILTPALVEARRRARLLTCASNVRQLCLALHNYAAAFRGRFPPHVSGVAWNDRARLGTVFGGGVTIRGAGAGELGGPAMTCPDDDGAVLSYAMNVWASSRLAIPPSSFTPQRGELFGPHTTGGHRLILVAEAYSAFTANGGWAAKPTIGDVGETPGPRFGAGGGVAPAAFLGRFGQRPSELPYYRHRGRSPGLGTFLKGAVHLGYADGHVALNDPHDMVDPALHVSNLQTLWSPLDPAINR